MKLGVGDTYRHRRAVMSFVKQNRLCDGHAYRTDTFHIACPIQIKFGTGNLHVILLRNREFNENRRSESHTLLRVAYLATYFTSRTKLREGSVSENVFTNCEFCFGEMNVIIYAQPKMYVNTIIPYLLTDLGEIWYKSSAHNAPEHLVSS